MLSVVGIAAKLMVYAGVAFLLGKTLANMPNKVYRFILLFLICLPLNFVINYINISWLGYHKMGWTGASIIAWLAPPSEPFGHRKRRNQVRRE